ncbi:NUMOD4 domain-containing protein [Mesorhizobium sp.]|uniref:NUMOD4 domain-containing protein n=1 Tax=Mesorhizobium sp. TaxID=1871066 RepID=UPI00257E85AA|nr:NUMOD4 domain-containing protein [Mesorhizobium sp.]
MVLGDDAGFPQPADPLATTPGEAMTAPSQTEYFTPWSIPHQDPHPHSQFGSRTETRYSHLVGRVSDAQCQGAVAALAPNSNLLSFDPSATTDKPDEAEPPTASSGPISIQWMPVNGYKGYEISNIGSVRNARTGREIKQFATKSGYLVVTLSGGGGTKNHKVHRLVAAAFIRPPKKGEEGNHLDLDKKNNNVENLEWVTSRENSCHYVAAMRAAGVSLERRKEASAIREYRVQTGASHRQIAAIFRVPKSTVANILARAVSPAAQFQKVQQS